MRSSAMSCHSRRSSPGWGAAGPARNAKPFITKRSGRRKLPASATNAAASCFREKTTVQSRYLSDWRHTTGALRLSSISTEDAACCCRLRPPVLPTRSVRPPSDSWRPVARKQVTSRFASFRGRRSLPETPLSLLILAISVAYVDHPGTFLYFIDIATMGFVYPLGTVSGPFVGGFASYLTQVGFQV